MPHSAPMVDPRATWPDFALYRPHPPAARLRDWVAEARAVSWAWLGDLTKETELGPREPLLNPPLWEVAHLAWFWEKWLLREGDTLRVPSRLVPQTDTLYDSMAVAHDTRWEIALLPWRDAWQYLDNVLGAVDARLGRDSLTDELAYFVQLCVFHHDMHNEAFAIRRQMLGDLPMAIARKALGDKALGPMRGADRVDIAFPQGAHALGAHKHVGFVFDNEKWAHEVRFAEFAIASHLVSQGEFAAYLTETGASPPPYWRCVGGNWQLRRFDQWQALDEDAPAVHVSAVEAEAYCAWAGRRLPSEVEWEHAHSALSATGQVWEWTASVFAPYPGFTPDPYTDYSAPWFDGNFRVLRGASIATAARNQWRTWRNFYKPHRSDMFCGFRTCAL